METMLGFFVPLAVVLIAVFAPGRVDLPEVIWGAKIKVASGGGYRGPWRMNESEYDYVDDPTVAINEQGVVAVAWADQSQKDIFFQIYAPNGKTRLEKPVNVSRSPRIFSWLPRMLITSTDPIEVYLLWQEIVFSGGSHGGEIFFARSSDGGKTWGEPRNLSNDIAGSGKGRITPRYWHNGSLDLTMGPEGNLYAAWTEYEGALRLSRSTDRGGSFSRPLRVAGGGDAKPVRGPSLAVDARGDVYLAWTVGEDRAANIHFAKSTDQGQSFGEPRIVWASEGHADAPKLAVDSKGTVHLVYAESPAGPFERYHIRYTRSNDRGRSFEAPKEIARPHTEQFASVHFPALSVDGRDNLYVIWELFPSRGNYSQGLGFTVSRDAGRTFASPTIIPGSLDPALGFNGSQQGLLMRKLAVNGAGAIAVVNSTFTRNEKSRVWLFRGQRNKVPEPIENRGQTGISSHVSRWGAKGAESIPGGRVQGPGLRWGGFLDKMHLSFARLEGVVAKRRVHLTFPGRLKDEPLLWQMCERHGVVFNIRQADYTEGLGWLMAELEGDEERLQTGIRWLEEQGVHVAPIEQDVVH